MKSRIFAVIALITLTACETVPATMDPALYETEFNRLDATLSIGAIEAQSETLLARTDLTDAQRANLLFLRAEKRLDSRFDVPGAMADYDGFALLLPEDPRVATAERRKIFATSEIDSAQRRLAQLQNLPNWFDDKVLMGDLDAAATRYRGSNLTPNESHVFLLKEAGYICADSGADASDPVHKLGPARDDVEGAIWCDNPSVS